MRQGLAAVCIAAIAALVAVLVSSDGSPAANGIYTVAVLVGMVAGLGGLVVLVVALLRD